MERKRNRIPVKTQRLTHTRKKIKTQEVNKEVQQQKPEDNAESINVLDNIKSDLPPEKVIELEETTKLKNSSKHLLEHFAVLSEKIMRMTDEVETASNTMLNWNYVFDTMNNVNPKSDRTTPFVKFGLKNNLPNN